MEIGPKTNGVYFRHGYAHTRIDHIYKSMVDRCENPKSYNYHKYGANGVHVCEEWKTNKKSFFEWAFNNGYKDSLTLDRINPLKGYSPENCRWVDYITQNNHRKSNRFIEIDGERKSVADWSRVSGLKQGTILYRINQGWNPKEAVYKPVPERR